MPSQPYRSLLFSSSAHLSRSGFRLQGLAALLVEGLSGATPEEILRLTPEFIELLGLKQSLTPSRNNGFLNMLRLMQKKTLTASAAAAASITPAAAASTTGAAAAGSSKAAGSAAERMLAKLTQGLAPTVLQLTDESSQHAGHSGAKGLRAGETHFKLTVRRRRPRARRRQQNQRAPGV